MEINLIFLLTIIFIFLAIFIESIFLILQLQGRKLTKWLGKHAFTFHGVVTSVIWIIAGIFILLLQFEKQQIFHNNIILNYIGLGLLIFGLVISTWGFLILGMERSLCINFYEDNIPIVESSLYKYIKNPEDNGLWIALIGFALFTGFIYNLIITIEFIIIMIPHEWLENRPLKKVEE